eukprot:COSAG01_NODE_10656_length_2111_cov_2.363817_2_plen_293_part_00
MLEKDYQLLLPVLSEETHKGERGRLGIIAGSKSMLGAAVMVALAALRTGVGLVYVMTVPDALPMIQAQYPELIVLPLSMDDEGGLDASSVPLVQAAFQKYRFSACCIGPGLGRSAGVVTFLKEMILFLQDQGRPVLLDADALRLLQVNELAGFKKQQLVLTPHVGEFEAMFGKQGDLQYDHAQRLASCQRAAHVLDQVMVLKGFKTVVSDGEHYVINQSGHANLATAGSGDVLSGMLASYLAQGLLPFKAALLAVYLHGLTGDTLLQKKGDSMIATDLISTLAEVIQRLRHL